MTESEAAVSTRAMATVETCVADAMVAARARVVMVASVTIVAMTVDATVTATMSGARL